MIKRRTRRRMNRSFIAVTCDRQASDTPATPDRPTSPAGKKQNMPKVKLAPFIEEIHGTMYDMVFKKSPQGEMIVTKKTDMSKVKWSKAQKSNRQHMSQAITTAQLALMDPKVK